MGRQVVVHQMKLVVQHSKSDYYAFGVILSALCILAIHTVSLCRRPCERKGREGKFLASASACACMYADVRASSPWPQSEGRVRRGGKNTQHCSFLSHAKGF